MLSLKQIAVWCQSCKLAGRRPGFGGLVVALFLLALLFPMGLHAQKKTISQARSYIKNGNNLEQAENMLRELLKDSAQRDNEKIRLHLFHAVKKQYEQGNEKLYLKQAYDTTRLFKDFQRMYDVMEELDSVAVAKNPKNQQYRRKYADMLYRYRPNLFNGGVYFMQKADFTTAYRFFDQYISSKEKPFFSACAADQPSDSLLPRAASYTVYCGYKAKDADATLRYVDVALADTARLDYLLQYMADTYKLMGDTLGYVETLHQGFNRYPKFMYFFPRLVEHYQDTGQLGKAMTVCQQALAVDAHNPVYLFAQATVFFRQEDFPACIAICDSLIARNDSLADAYYYAGMAYVQQAMQLDRQNRTARQYKAQRQAYYKKALPYMQRLRELLPDERQKWGAPLYTIYLNLNMGKEFEEIDKLLKDERKE